MSKNGRMIELIERSFEMRGHAILNLQYPQVGLEEKHKAFHKYFLPFFKITQELIRKMLDGVSAMQDPKDTRWNFLNAYLLAGAC